MTGHLAFYETNLLPGSQHLLPNLTKLQGPVFLLTETIPWFTIFWSFQEKLKQIVIAFNFSFFMVVRNRVNCYQKLRLADSVLIYLFTFLCPLYEPFLQPFPLLSSIVLPYSTVISVVILFYSFISRHLRENRENSLKI